MSLVCLQVLVLLTSSIFELVTVECFVLIKFVFHRPAIDGGRLPFSNNHM